MTPLRVGACLSLTGRYGRFGRQAAHGLMAWQRLAGTDVEFEIEDDGSDPEQFTDRFGRVASRCDLLLGPYSTQLMRAAGQAMTEIDAVLWNQGGSGDDVQALCPGRIVSVLAPTSRYAVPFVESRADESERAPLWVVRARGRFGRQVARGAVEQAARDGLEAVEHRVGDGWSFEDRQTTGTCSRAERSRTTSRSCARPGGSAAATGDLFDRGRCAGVRLGG